MENLSSPLATMAINETVKKSPTVSEPMDDAPQWNGYTTELQANGSMNETDS